MPYQMTIKAAGTSLAELFAHGTMHQLSPLPYTVGGAGCHCQLPSAALAPDQVVFSLTETRLGELELSASGFLPIVINGNELKNQSAILHNGDRLETGGAAIRVYRSHGRPGVSAVCNILTYTAITCAVFFFVLEFFTIGIMPIIVAKSSSWNAYRDRQIISKTLENVRKDFRNNTSGDALEHALVLAIREEINSIVAYFKANYDSLSPRQRRELMNRVTALQKAGNAAIDARKENQNIQIDLDPIVRSIIGEQ